MNHLLLRFMCMVYSRFCYDNYNGFEWVIALNVLRNHGTSTPLIGPTWGPRAPVRRAGLGLGWEVGPLGWAPKQII
jgi:hypothetical protein